MDNNQKAILNVLTNIICESYALNDTIYKHAFSFTQNFYDCKKRKRYDWVKQGHAGRDDGSPIDRCYFELFGIISIKENITFSELLYLFHQLLNQP